jgi:hypothetical protein
VIHCEGDVGGAARGGKAALVAQALCEFFGE